MVTDYTRDEAEYLLKEAIGKQRVQVTRDQILDILDKQDKGGKGRFVSITYVKPVTIYKKRSSIDIPSMQGSLERYKDNSDADWYKSLSDFSNDETAKKNPISSIIVAQHYVLHWGSKESYNKAYGDYNNKLTTLRQRYGVGTDTAGVFGDNNNQRSVSNGETFSQRGNLMRDFNMAHSTVKTTNYVVDETGHIVSEIPNDIVKMISSTKKSSVVEKTVADALADNPQALGEYEAAKKELMQTFRSQTFIFDKILSIVASVDGIDYYFINDKLISPIADKSEVNVNPDEMLAIAKEQLNQSFNDIEASEFAN